MATATVKKHPIRGAIWGLFMGIGLSLILAGRKVIAFGETSSFVIVIVIGVVVGIVWGMFGPAKGPKGPEPVDVVEPAAEESAAAPASFVAPDDPADSPEGDDADDDSSDGDDDDGDDDDPARVTV